MTRINPQYHIKYNNKILGKEFIFGLAEKPTAAKRIAKILDPKHIQVNLKISKKINGDKIDLPGVSGYLVFYKSHSIFILSALGHLFTLVQDGFGWQYPVYDFKWVSLSETIKEDTNFKMRIEATIECIRHFANLTKNHVIMTDYDEEGEVIGALTISQLVNDNAVLDAKRMRFSSFATDEIMKSFDKALGSTDSLVNQGMYNRGLMRHYLDWLWGINLSRALMLSLKNTSGRYHTLSTGRVQGPTLSFVAQREFERRTHVPVPIFKMDVSVVRGTETLNLKYNGGPFNVHNKATSLRKEIKDKKAIVSEIKKRKLKTAAPVPYNLSSLQKDAYKYYRINPSRVLQIAEKLYLSAAISYPRTSSEQYPSDLDHRNVLKKLSRQKEFSQYSREVMALQKLKPKEGKKKDPAHPCIYPTGSSPKLTREQDKKIYGLIAHRYLAGFGSDAVSESNRVEFSIGVHTFHITGSRMVDLGWKKWAGIMGRVTESELPKFRKGSKLDLDKVSVVTTYSKPLPAFNQASLLRMMETFEIGTKATRSEIINSIFKRRYLTGDSIRLTPVGEIVNDVLQAYSPQVVSVELSRNLEKMGDLIEENYNNGNNSFNLQDAVTQGILHLHDMLDSLKKMEQDIGFLIDLNLTHLRREEGIVGPCMGCKIGTLKILRSIKSGKRFVGCSQFFENKSCDVTFPLPQKGRIEILDKQCKADNFPQLKIMGGRRPWILCLNQDCELRIDFNKKSKKKGVKK